MFVVVVAVVVVVWLGFFWRGGGLLLLLFCFVFFSEGQSRGFNKVREIERQRDREGD